MLLCGEGSGSYNSIISKMKWKKICHWLMTLILMVVFLVLSSISLNSLLSWKVGTRLKVEIGPKHPDMTFCSFAYNRKHNNLITQINPNNSSSNYSLSDIEKLPAIKEMIKFMWIYHHEHDDDKSLINWVWANSALVPNANINESDFIQESFVIWPGNYWHKCVTLKFPEEWNLGTQSHLSLIFNYTLIDRFMIQYHSRGQAKILSSSSNVYLTTFPSYGSVYDLKMKKKTYLRDCTDDKKQAEYDCIMKFIASKMNCTIVLAEKKFYPDNYPLCKTKYELRLYAKIRKNVYNGNYSKELKHCFVRRCTEASWIASYQAPITKEHNKYIMEVLKYNESEKMALLTFWMPYSEVDVAEQYVIYNLPDFIGDFGGYLGLFLGWSIQSILFGFVFKIKEIYFRYCCKKSDSDTREQQKNTNDVKVKQVLHQENGHSKNPIVEELT